MLVLLALHVGTDYSGQAESTTQWTELGISMSSDLPSKPPAGASGSYVWAAIVMLVVAGGLVTWRMTHPSSPAPVESAMPAISEQPKVSEPPPPPPPPPEEQPAATASASAAPALKTVRAASSCGGECKGEVSTELRSYLSGRAGQGRKCYERSLLQNASLKGRLKVQLRLSAQGQLCSASMSNDELQDPGLNACILQMFRNSVYPAPKNGCVDVAVPLSFVPQR